MQTEKSKKNGQKSNYAFIPSVLNWCASIVQRL